MANLPSIIEPSRRRFLATGATIAVFTSVADTFVPADARRSPFAVALERHKDAYAAILATCGGENDIPADLTEAAYDAFAELAKTPCADDAELIAKTRYMLNHALGERLNERSFLSEGFDSVLLALDLHFNPAEYA